MRRRIVIHTNPPDQARAQTRLGSTRSSRPKFKPKTLQETLQKQTQTRLKHDDKIERESFLGRTNSRTSGAQQINSNLSKQWIPKLSVILYYIESIASQKAPISSDTDRTELDKERPPGQPPPSGHYEERKHKGERSPRCANPP